MISFLLFPRNSVGRKNKSRAYLAHVNARVFGNDRADVERDEAEVVCGLEARAHLELDAVDVPLNSQWRVADGQDAALKVGVLALGQFGRSSQRCREDGLVEGRVLDAAGRAALALLQLLDLSHTLRMLALQLDVGLRYDLNGRRRHGLAWTTNANVSFLFVQQFI